METLGDNISDLNDRLGELEQRVGALEEGGATLTPLLQNGYIAQGSDPNNWVIFEVRSDTSKVSYFPNDSDRDKWRVLSIDSNGKIKLVYNKSAGTNNDLTLNKSKSYTCSNDDVKFYSLNDSTSKNYYSYNSKTSWNYNELMENNGYESKKKNLVNSLIHLNYVEESNYYYTYKSTTTTIKDLDTTEISKQLMGTITLNELKNTNFANETWIKTPIILGYTSNLNGEYIIYANSGTTVKGKNPSIKSCSGRYTLYGYDYLPTVVLKSNVKLVKNDSCSSGATQGSRECPYKLSCDNC